MTSLFKSPLRLALVASLAINAFFIAHMAALWFAGPPGPPPGGPRGGGFRIERLFENPSPRLLEIAAEIREQRRPAFEAARRELRAARRAARGLLEVEPFDAEAFLAARARVMEARLARRRVADEGLAAFAERLTAEERAELAEALRKRRADRRKHRARARQ